MSLEKGVENLLGIQTPVTFRGSYEADGLARNTEGPASGQNWLMATEIIELVTGILRIRFVNGITYTTLVSQFP